MVCQTHSERKKKLLSVDYKKKINNCIIYKPETVYFAVQCSVLNKHPILILEQCVPNSLFKKLLLWVQSLILNTTKTNNIIILYFSNWKRECDAWYVYIPLCVLDQSTITQVQTSTMSPVQLSLYSVKCNHVINLMHRQHTYCVSQVTTCDF